MYCCRALSVLHTPACERFVISPDGPSNPTTTLCRARDKHLFRLLVVNEARLFSLRAGLGSEGDRYGLEHLPADSIPEGVELVSCEIVPTCRGSGRYLGLDDGKTSPLLQGTPGMVCVAMIAPPLTVNPPAARGTAQGDAAGGAPARSSVPALSTSSSAESPFGGGQLNVYTLGGERSFEVERALQRQPQQLSLPYIPVGVTHTTVWRNTTAPQYVGETASSTDHCEVERGDAVLVWDQDGVVHGYTRWEGFLADGRGYGGVDGGRGATAVLTVESRESLEALIPELRGIDSPVLSLSIDAVNEGHGVRRRQVMAGCMDGVRRVSFEVTSGIKETAVAFANGPVSAVAPNTCPRFVPHSSGLVDDSWEREVLGVACTRLGTVAWLVEGGSGGEERPRWLMDTPPLADADKLVCMGCADFCRDGSTCVAVGTYLGKVIIYGFPAEDAHENEEEVIADHSDEIFGATWVDEDESTPEAAPESRPRRGDSVSPRLPDTERHYRVTDRPGGVDSSANPRLSAAKWQRDVPHPVFGIVWGDFNHDGVSEMVVATQYGVHVFRPDYKEEANRFARMLHTLKNLQPEKAESVATRSDDDESGVVSLIGMEIHNVGADR